MAFPESDIAELDTQAELDYFDKQKRQLQQSIKEATVLRTLVGNGGWEFVRQYIEDTCEVLKREAVSASFAYETFVDDQGAAHHRPLHPDQVALKHASVAAEYQALRKLINSVDLMLKKGETAAKELEQVKKQEQELEHDAFESELPG